MLRRRVPEDKRPTQMFDITCNCNPGRTGLTRPLRTSWSQALPGLACLRRRSKLSHVGCRGIHPGDRSSERWAAKAHPFRMGFQEREEALRPPKICDFRTVVPHRPSVQQPFSGCPHRVQCVGSVNPTRKGGLGCTSWPRGIIRGPIRSLFCQAPVVAAPWTAVPAAAARRCGRSQRQRCAAARAACAAAAPPWQGSP